MRKVICTATMIASLALALPLVQAQGMGPGPQGGGPHQQMGLLGALAQLDLNEEQRNEIRALMEAFRPRVEAAMTAIDEIERLLRQTVHESGYNEALLRPIAEAKGAAVVALTLIHAELDSEIIGLLTPEQLELLESMRPDGEPGNRNESNSDNRPGGGRRGPGSGPRK